MLLELQMDRQIIGESAAMKKIFELIKKVSGTDTAVLISGESGTGKELVGQCWRAGAPATPNSIFSQLKYSR